MLLVLNSFVQKRLIIERWRSTILTPLTRVRIDQNNQGVESSETTVLGHCVVSKIILLESDLSKISVTARRLRFWVTVWSVKSFYLNQICLKSASQPLQVPIRLPSPEIPSVAGSESSWNSSASTPCACSSLSARPHTKSDWSLCEDRVSVWRSLANSSRCDLISRHLSQLTTRRRCRRPRSRSSVCNVHHYHAVKKR